MRCGFGARFWSGGEFVSLVALLAVPLRLLLACSSFGGLSPSGLVVHEQVVLQVILQNGSRISCEFCLQARCTKSEGLSFFLL